MVDGHYRNYLSRLHERLGEARPSVVRAFERIGLELFAEPSDGMFVWAHVPHVATTRWCWPKCPNAKVSC